MGLFLEKFPETPYRCNGARYITYLLERGYQASIFPVVSLLMKTLPFPSPPHDRVQRSPSPGHDQHPSDVVHFSGNGLAPPKQRPTSALSEDLPPTTSLYPFVEPPPSPRSLPATPLSKKREQLEAASTSPQYSSPEHESVPTSPLAITEIKAPAPEPVKPVPPVRVVFKPEPSPPSAARQATEPVKPVKAPVPEFLQQRFVFDDIRDFLDSLPERTVEPSYERLPPEDETWLDRPTGVEQLREFLAICV